MERNGEALCEADYKVHYKTKVVSTGSQYGKVTDNSAVCATFAECKAFHRELRNEPVYTVGNLTKMIIIKSVWYEGPDGKPIDKPRAKKPALHITYGVARQYLRYDGKTGALVWRMGSRRNKNAIRIGANNHPFVHFMGAERSAQRLCWMLHHQREPVSNIRNISGNKLDLRIHNLKEI